MVYRLTLAYRGAAYAGWQRQSNALAVQQVVEEALAGVFGESVTIHGAGRTDAGVHARGQMAHFESERSFPCRGLVHATNRILPDDVRVMRAYRMPEGFHARKHARSKEYRYRFVRSEIVSPLEAPWAVRLQRDCDLELMEAATRRLVGRHDFTAFALAGGAHKTARRTILSGRWVKRGETLTLRLVGEGFLRGMVRSLVGTLVEVGKGGRTVADFERLLAGATRGEAGPTAPAHGLVLHRVVYPEAWEPLDEWPAPIELQ